MQIAHVPAIAGPLLPLHDWLAPQGILTVTTGTSELHRALSARYGASSIKAIADQWRADLAAAPAARGWVLGVPFDTGAGFERGSFKGPMALRTTPALDRTTLRDAGWVDLGDVRCNPQLTHDSAHSPLLLDEIRAARGWFAPHQAAWPVAPLSLLHATLSALLATADRPFLVLGGDHSLSRIPVEALMAAHPGRRLAVLHVDAHTDLLEHREGVRYSFATWAWHARRATGDAPFVQCGIRASGRDRDHWETTKGVRQFWAEAIRQSPGPSMSAALDALCADSPDALYISIDVDGLDPSEVWATGTREPHGLSCAWVCALIAGAAARLPVVGADVVELAPPLSQGAEGEPETSIASAGRVVRALLAAMGQSPDGHGAPSASI